MIPPPPWKERVLIQKNKHVLSFLKMKFRRFQWRSKEVVG